jgi:hypothetical protein
VIAIIGEAVLVCELPQVTQDSFLPCVPLLKALSSVFEQLVLQADDVGRGVGAMDTPSALA